MYPVWLYFGFILFLFLYTEWNIAILVKKVDFGVHFFNVFGSRWGVSVWQNRDCRAHSRQFQWIMLGSASYLPHYRRGQEGQSSQSGLATSDDLMPGIEICSCSLREVFVYTPRKNFLHKRVDWTYRQKLLMATKGWPKWQSLSATKLFPEPADQHCHSQFVPTTGWMNIWINFHGCLRWS